EEVRRRAIFGHIAHNAGRRLEEHAVRWAIVIWVWVLGRKTRHRPTQESKFRLALETDGDARPPIVIVLGRSIVLKIQISVQCCACESATEGVERDPRILKLLYLRRSSVEKPRRLLRHHQEHTHHDRENRARE